MHVIGTIASSILKSNAAFDSIATASGTGSSGVITFSSIPSTYKHLQLRILARTNEVATGGALMLLQFNGVSTTSYAQHEIRGANGGSLTAARYANQSQIETAWYVRDSELTNDYGVGIIDILDYASTAKYKTVRVYSGYEANTGGSRMTLSSGLFMSTSAISSLTLNGSAGSNSFLTGSKFALYGIKG